jgi:hypothetical protein
MARKRGKGSRIQRSVRSVRKRARSIRSKIKARVSEIENE